MFLQLVFIIIGFALLIWGADLLVSGSSQIAARFGLPDRVIGLTVVAVGTAMPELVVSVVSAVEGHADMAFGNVVGSCIANLLLILGMSEDLFWGADTRFLEAVAANKAAYDTWLEAARGTMRKEAEKRHGKAKR